MDIQTLYRELSPFYILLYLHDITDFATEQLASLLMQLKSLSRLGETEEIVHKALVEASYRNKAAKLKNKKKAVSKAFAEKKEAFVPILPPSVLRSQSDFVNESNLEGMEFIDESCLFHDDKPERQYEEINSVEGKLFGGELYVQLPVEYEAFPGHPQTAYIDFNIDHKAKVNKLNINVVLRLLRMQKLIKSTINMKVSGIPSQFQICEGESVLGMSYLQNGKVIVSTNYRPEVQRFQMIFTR